MAKFKLPNKFNKNNSNVSPVGLMQTYQRATAQEINDARATLRKSKVNAISKFADHMQDESISELVFNTKQWVQTLKLTLATNGGMMPKNQLVNLWVKSTLQQLNDRGMQIMFYCATELIGEGTQEEIKNYIKL